MYSLAIFLAVISAAVSTPLVGYPNCHPTSKTVDLRISDLYFHSSRVYSTPAHQVAGGSISFNITNPAAGITTSCSASSTQIYDYFYGDLWYHCQKTDGVDDTEFTFNRTTGQINLTQRWTCKDPSSPLGYIAWGGGTKALDCNTDEYQNQGWRPGSGIFSSYTTECNKTDLPITAQISKVILAVAADES